MRKTVGSLLGGLAAVGVFSSFAAAQTPGASTPTGTPSGPQVGQVAPDFSLPGATRYGLLRTPVRLTDYRGSTVVLAFFFQARTKG